MTIRRFFVVLFSAACFGMAVASLSLAILARSI